MANTRKARNAKRLKELKEELKEVNRAIKEILRAQSYKTGSRSVTKANLDTLYNRKEKLEADIASLEGGAGLFRRVVIVSN